MSNIILIPDSFKGSLSASQVADIMEKAIKEVDPSMGIKKIPISDGGEGFLEFYQATHSKSKITKTYLTDEQGKKKEVSYLLDGNLAIVETAQILGLPQAAGDVMDRSSYALGQLLLEVSDNKTVDKIVLSVGGTATIDMGLGILEALGAIFLDFSGNVISPKPRNIAEIKTIDESSLKKLKPILVLSDVNNTLYGKESGIVEYSPQKGASKQEIDMLIKNYKRIIPSNKDQKYFGSGGGISAALVLFLHATIMSGMEFVLDKIDFEALSKNIDYVLTGEGSIDGQSFQGKVLGEIYNASYRSKIPVIAFAGEVKEKINKHLLFCISIHSSKESYMNYKNNSEVNLHKKVKDIINLINLKKDNL